MPAFAWPPSRYADNRIISVAHALNREGKRVIFISKDINARIKSDTLGIPTEDFEAQKVDFEHLYTGWRELKVSPDAISRLFSERASSWTRRSSPTNSSCSRRNR